jgi:hypothetical protein
MVERCHALMIRRHLPDGCLQLQAHSEESLQQRIMQLPRDAFALPSAFVKPHTEFPMGARAINAPKELIDDLGRPVVARKRKSAIRYIRGSLNTAIHHCLSLPIPEPALCVPDQFGCDRYISKEGTQLSNAASIFRGCTICAETKRLPAIPGRNARMNVRRYFVCYTARRTVTCEITLMARRASKLSVIT